LAVLKPSICMKTSRCIAFFVVLVWQPFASAQFYSIDWHSIDGGGGSSAAGAFSLIGTIGQPDASGMLTGGSFSLTGGFWSVVPSAGAPRLTAYLTNLNRIVISWPSPSTGFTLQQAATLAPFNWGTPSETVTDNGMNKFIIVNPPTGNRFYRLFKP